MKKRLYLSNGFHGTTTYLLVEPKEGTIIPGRIIRRAEHRLCGVGRCLCTSSAASNPREGQRVGWDEPYHLEPTHNDTDDFIVVRND